MDYRFTTWNSPNKPLTCPPTSLNQKQSVKTTVKWQSHNPPLLLSLKSKNVWHFGINSILVIVYEFLAASHDIKHLVPVFCSGCCSGTVLGEQPDWGNLRDSFQSDPKSERSFSETQQAGWDQDCPDGLVQPQVSQKESCHYNQLFFSVTEMYTNNVTITMFVLISISNKSLLPLSFCFCTEIWSPSTFHIISFTWFHPTYPDLWCT